MIEVKVDLRGLEAKVLQLATISRKTVGESLAPEMRLLSVQLARYTQPFGFDGNAKAQGENAILRDVSEAFYILPDSLCAKASLIKSGQYAGYMQIFAKKSGVVFITEERNWRISDGTQTLFRHHQELRNRDGRVPRNRNKVESDGNFAIINLWVITQSQLNAYLPFIQKEVGFAKSGWSTCADQLGGHRGIPGWVSRHHAPGRVEKKTDSDRPSITIRNDVNYTDRVLSESGQRGAVRDAEFRLQKRIDAALKHGVKNA